MSTYFQDIKDGVRSTLKGLQLTFRHFKNATERRKPLGIASDNYFEQVNGLVTVQYPHEKLPIPDNGRYRLHNEIDDCIVCDKCAKVCPVDCITIEAIKATEEIGRASDGSPIRLYAGKFDIDMAKCCYCGLCTVVCPTECLTMEKTFDYSEFELGNLTYGFSNLTPEQAEEKRKLYEQFVAEKEALKAQQAAAKAAAPATPVGETEAKPVPKRPVFRPGQKPAKATEATADAGEIPVAGIPSTESSALLTTDKGVSTSGETNPPADAENTVQPTEVTAPKPARPAFRPSMKPAASKSLDEAVKPEKVEEKEPLPQTRPVDGTSVDDEKPKLKPAFRPTMKPKVAPAPEAEPVATTKDIADPQVSEEIPVVPKPKPVFRPSMKPKVETESKPSVEPVATNLGADAVDAEKPIEAASPKPKPAFRPTMKPKPPTSD